MFHAVNPEFCFWSCVTVSDVAHNL